MDKILLNSEFDIFSGLTRQFCVLGGPPFGHATKHTEPTRKALEYVKLTVQKYFFPYQVLKSLYK